MTEVDITPIGPVETFKVVVEFIVKAEPLGPFPSEQCAIDFVRHRIDEGYRLEEQIKDWNFVSITKADSA